MYQIINRLSCEGSSGGKEFACKAGDLGLIPGSGRSPGEGNGNPLQYSCLGNSMDRGAWEATVHGVTQCGSQLSLAWHPPSQHGQAPYGPHRGEDTALEPP